MLKTSAFNTMGRFFQGAGVGNQDEQRVKVTDLFYFIPHDKVPKNKVKEVTYAHMVYNIREMKNHKHRTRITVGDNEIKYKVSEGTPEDHFEKSKLLFKRPI